MPVFRNNQPRSIGIPPEEWDPAKARADREGTTVSEVCRRAVREYGASEDAPNGALFDAIKQAIERYGSKS